MTWHARKRLYQRYGKKLKNSDLKKMSEGIKMQYYFRLYHYYDIVRGGMTVIIKYNKELYKIVCFTDGTILTALPYDVSKNTIDLINLPDIGDVFV